MSGSQKLLAFARQNLFLVGGAAVSLAIVLFVVTSLLMNFIYFNDPRHQDEALKGWMTPRYVGLSYDLPRPLLIELLKVEPGKPIRMREVAENMGLTLEELTTLVRDAADEHRNERK